MIGMYLRMDEVQMTRVQWNQTIHGWKPCSWGFEVWARKKEYQAYPPTLTCTEGVGQVNVPRNVRRCSHQACVNTSCRTKLQGICRQFLITYASVLVRLLECEIHFVGTVRPLFCAKPQGSRRRGAEKTGQRELWLQTEVTTSVLWAGSTPVSYSSVRFWWSTPSWHIHQVQHSSEQPIRCAVCGCTKRGRVRPAASPPPVANCGTAT